MTTWTYMRKQLAGTAMNGRAVYISIPIRDGVTPLFTHYLGQANRILELITFKSLEKASNIFLCLEDIKVRITKKEAKRLLSGRNWEEVMNLFDLKPWDGEFAIVYRHSQLKRSGGCEETESNSVVE